MNSRHLIFLILIAILFSSNGTTVWADDEDSVNIDEIVVTSSRLKQYAYKTPSNVTVIEQKEIQDSGEKTVAGVLEASAGLHVFNTSLIKTDKVDIRGFGDTASSNVLVLVNGRKVNPIDISGPDLIQIPIESVERIEVIRGAASVLYGDNAVGGVVNIITKKGKETPSSRIGAQYGSYDTHQVDLETSGQKKNLSYYVYSKYDEEGGYRSNSDILAKDFQTRLGYDFSEQFKTEISAGWHQDEYGLPGGINQTELETLGRRGSVTEENYASSKDRFVDVGFDISPWKNEEEDFGNILLDYSYRNRDAYSLLDFGNFGAIATKSNIDTNGVTLKYTYAQPLGDRDFHFISGVDLYNTDNDILGSGSGLSASSDDLTISKDEFGIYTSAEYEILKNLHLNGGTRFQKAYYTFDHRNASIYETQSPSDQVSSGGLRYEYAKGSNLHASFEQTFRFLATDEWYDIFNGLDTSLQQQTGVQYEVGWKHNIQDKVNLSVTPYWIDLKNEIYFDPYVIAFGRNANYDRTRRKGVEVAQETDLLKLLDISGLDQLRLSDSFTYQEPKFRDGSYVGRDIPMVPRYQASQGLKIGFLRNLLFNLNATYTGSRFAVNDTRNEAPKVKPNWVLDSQLTYRKDPIEVFFAVNNLLNEEYFSYVVKSATSTTIDYFPALGRNFNVGVNYRF